MLDFTMPKRKKKVKVAAPEIPITTTANVGEEQASTITASISEESGSGPRDEMIHNSAEPVYKDLK